MRVLGIIAAAVAVLLAVNYAVVFSQEQQPPAPEPDKWDDADWYVLDAHGRNKYRVLFHIRAPDGENVAGVSWVDAVRQDTQNDFDTNRIEPVLVDRFSEGRVTDIVNGRIVERIRVVKTSTRFFDSLDQMHEELTERTQKEIQARYRFWSADSVTSE